MNRALRTGAILLAAILPGTALAGTVKPQRILSMNQCADLLLLQLVPKARIASVTYLAREGAASLFPGAANGIAINHGTPEDIVNLRPDLIVAGDFSTAMTRRLARRVGAPLVEVRTAASFADIRGNLRRLGEAVGEPARAELLIARMDLTLARLAADPRPAPRPVVVWSGGATVPGQDTLTNAIVTAAGARNIAARPGPADASFGVEDLLAARPEALLYAGAAPGVRSLTTDAGQHGAVRRLYASRRIAFDGIVHACGLPQSVDGARDLRRALDALPSGPVQ